MGMTPTTYTVHNLAVELGRDVRLVQRALAGVPPDELVGKRRRWRLTTALAALEAHGAIKGARSNETAPSSSGLGQVLDELEHAAADLQAAIDMLRAEKSVARRRAKAKVIGPLLTRYQEVLDRSGEMLPPNLAALTKAARSEILGEALAEIAAVLALDFDRCA